MLFRKIVTIICANRTKRVKTRCGQNAGYFIVKPRTAWNYSCFSKCLTVCHFHSSKHTYRKK